MQVQELMQSAPASCGPDDSLDVAARLMWERDIGCVPVVDQKGHAISVITDRDVAMAAYTRGVSLSQVRVGEVANQTLVSCLPTDALAHAERLMAQHQVRRLPVVDSFGKLVGMLSQNDLVREAVSERRGRKQEVSEDEVLRVLNAIGAPRHQSLAATA